MTAMQRIARTLYLALVTPGTHMPMLVGAPGGGKTTLEGFVATALGVADEHNLVWIPAQRSPEDFNGWATPRPDGLHFEVPHAVRTACEADRALIFLDECSNTPRATQAAMLRFICERAMGDRRLPRSVMMMGAMNPPDHAADAQDISRPLANRCVWLPFPNVTTDEHVAFMLRNEAPEQFDFPVVDPEAWARAYREATAVYSVFMRQHPDALHENPDSPDVVARFSFTRDRADRTLFPAYCTPRSWSTMVRLAATCKAVGDMDALADFAWGTVGPAFGLEFAAMIENNDMLDPEDMLSGKVVFEPDDSRTDRTFGQLILLAQASCNDIKRWHRAWTIIGGLMDRVGKDIVLVAGRHMFQNKPKGPVSKEVAATVNELYPISTAAGWEAE